MFLFLGGEYFLLFLFAWCYSKYLEALLYKPNLIRLVRSNYYAPTTD